MKKITSILIVFCAFGRLLAQEGFESYWDSAYREIKQTGSLKSGYFWDLGMPDSSLSFYQGKPMDSASTFNQWSLICGYFENSAIVQNPTVKTYENIKKVLEMHLDAGMIAVPVLFAKGGRIKPSAIENKTVYMDSIQGVWKTNDPGNAFQIEEVFIAAPYVQVSFKQVVQLLFSDELFVGNPGMHIQDIAVKIRNENFVKAVKDIPYNLALMPGNNEVIFAFVLNDGRRYESRTNLFYETRIFGMDIEDKYDYFNPFHFGDKKGNIYAEPIRETEFQQKLGAFIDYLPGYNNGQTNTCIQKPLVIVEGIDFGFKNYATGCYGGKCGNIGLIDLENGFILNPYEQNPKERIEEWKAIEKSPKLINELRNKGYDIFYIDFHNGAEYMENNAMLVVKFLQLLNSNKCSNEEIVVLGASMGGVVSKYALSYMEKNKIPHCVRTFLSFDAPHRGANIPLGLQAFMKYFRKKLPGVKETYDRKINRAATRQLLIYHIESPYKSSKHSQRDDFLHKLKLLGNYPQWSRNISITNGNINSSFQNFDPGDKLLAMNPFIGKLDGSPFNFSATVYAMSRSVENKEIVLEVKMPLGKKYYEFVDRYRFLPDNIPGSLRYDLRDSRKIYGLFNIINYHSSSCFIPTYSSLDVAENIVLTDLAAKLDPLKPNPKLYPFQTYFGVANTNEEHMQLTDENIRWAIEEIEKNRNEVSFTLNKVYNFGRFERYTLRDVSIEANGVLQINGNYNNGYGNGQYDKANTPGSKFEMFTSDCNPVVMIDKGGKLILGDNNGNDNNKAVLRIRKGSVLKIKAGGSLVIHQGSQLVIEEGAELSYFPGAIIILDGNDAELQIDGKLRLEKDAVFSIVKGETNQTGFVKFRNVRGGYGSACIEIGGANTSIDLKGNGSSSDLILQIEGELKTFTKDNPYRLKSFKISEAMVLYGNNSRIHTNADLEVHDVVFNKLYWANSGSSDAFLLSNVANVHISACEFKQLRIAVKLVGEPQKENVLGIEGSRFTDCSVGVYGSYSKIEIDQSVFENCSEAGIYSYDSESDLKLTNSRFSKNDIGVQVYHTNPFGVYVFVENCDFNENTKGMDLKFCQTTISCSRFIKNLTGLMLNQGALNISRNQNFTGNTNSAVGGDNTFGYNQDAGISLYATVLFMDDGYNNFLQDPDLSAFNFLKGEISYSSLTHENKSPHYLRANNNYWNRMHTNGLPDGAITYYFVKFPFPSGQVSTINYFKGDLLTDLNTLCYKGACNSCDRQVISAQTYSQKHETINDSLNIHISPYPADGILNFEFSSNTTQNELHFKLTNLKGQVIYQLITKEGKGAIPTADLLNGIYLLEIKGEGVFRIQKIIIQH